MFKPSIFEDIINKLYGETPYQGLKNIQPNELPQINGELFEFLIKIIQPQIILDMGSEKGESAIKMAQVLDTNNLKESVIICVNTWLGSPETLLNKDNQEWGIDSLNLINGFPNIYKTFLSNVIHSNLQDKIIPFPQTTENAAVIFHKLNLKFDLIYLDTVSEYQALTRNLEAYWQLLNPQGVICGSGYLQRQGVTKAIDNFANKFVLKVYDKGGKYLLIKGDRNLVGLESLELQEELIKPDKSEKEIIALGLSAREQGKEEEALKYFEQAIVAYPKKVLGYVESGKSLRVLQRLEEAKERFKQALERNPRTLGALMGLGQMAAREWELEIALENLKRAIEYHPNHLIAYEQAAIQLRNLKRFVQAEEIADLGLTKAKDEQQSFALLREKAFALVGQLKLDEGSKILGQLARIQGSNHLFIQAAKVLTTQKKFDEAIELFDQNIALLREISSSFLNLWRTRSIILYAQQKYEEDIKLSQINKRYQIIEVHPQKALLKYPIEQFDLNKISLQKTILFSDGTKNQKSDQINYIFDDLEGILAKEKLKLSDGAFFNIPILECTERRIITAPNIYIRSENDDIKIFSLDGYYFDELGNDYNHYLIFSNHSIIYSEIKKIDIAFIVINSLYNNYYHVLVEIVPSLLIYKKLNLKCPIIFPSISSKILKTLLTILDIPTENILLHETSDKTLVDFGIVLGKITLDREIVLFYQKIAESVLANNNTKMTSSKRIYISRRKTSGRILLNEEEVENMLLAFGFSICYMENYTFEEQIAIIRNSTIIVAPHGAGLTNILFAQPRITIVELLTEHYPESCFYRIARLCNHKYYPVLGELKEAKDWQQDQDYYQNFRWEIDLIKLKRVLEKVIS